MSGSVPAISYSRLWSVLLRASASTDAERQTDCGEAQAVDDNHGQHITDLRAKGEANSNL